MNRLSTFLVALQCELTLDFPVPNLVEIIIIITVINIFNNVYFQRGGGGGGVGTRHLANVFYYRFPTEQNELCFCCSFLCFQAS